MSWQRKLFIAPFILCALLWSKPSLRAGALAVGVPPDVARQGFAAGHALNAPTPDKARRGATESCHGSTGASEEAKKLCNVVATFSDQCYAIALDPKDGTPGVGWAIAKTQEAADAQAIAQCRNTAGPSRRDFCTIFSNNRGCDGNARVQAAAEDFGSLDGTWEGDLKRIDLTGEGKSTTAWWRRIIIEGGRGRVFYKSDEKINEAKPGKFRVERRLANAVIVAINSGNDNEGTWVRNLGICCHPKGQKYAHYEFHATSEQYQSAAIGR